MLSWLLFFCLQISANPSCSTIDFRAQLGEPRDQENTGWCYANTTADMISQAVGYRVSAMAIATDYLSIDEKTFQNPMSPEQKKYIRGNPGVQEDIRDIRNVSPENWEAKNIYSFSTEKDDDGDDIYTYNGLMDVGGQEDLALLAASNNGLCKDSLLPGGEAEYPAYAKILADRQKLLQQPLPNDLPQTRTIQSVKKEIPQLNLLQDFVNERCGQRLPAPRKWVPATLILKDSLDDWNAFRNKHPAKAKSEQETLFNRIDKNLERGSISAIGYDYCEQVIPNTFSGECSKTAKKPNTPLITEDHSGIIAARKMIGGECRYFLRNSIGATCDLYQTRFLDAHLCEASAGGLWVKKSELSSLYGVTSIR